MRSIVIIAATAASAASAGYHLGGIPGATTLGNLATMIAIAALNQGTCHPMVVLSPHMENIAHIERLLLSMVGATWLKVGVTLGCGVLGYSYLGRITAVALPFFGRKPERSVEISMGVVGRRPNATLSTIPVRGLRRLIPTVCKLAFSGLLGVAQVAVQVAGGRLIDKILHVVDRGSNLLFAGACIGAVYWGISTKIREEAVKTHDNFSVQVLVVTDTTLLIGSTGAALYLLYTTASRI